ncbi:MAG: type II toxin-antitoxin system VapC family toxin [Methylohalobius sp. ZOD2]
MILSDTGFWLALINRNDRYHTHAVAAMQDLAENLVTTWPVVTETCHLLGRFLGVEAQTAFVEMLRSGWVELADIGEQDLARIGRLMEKYEDLPMDLADASLVILAERLGHGRILSTDRRDFQTYRWKNREPFENLLLTDY